jgi:hypothetical protein
VASLAALVVAVGHSLSSTLRKVFLGDLHQVPNVETSRDVVEARLMQRAPFLGGRLRSDAHGSIGPIFSSRHGDGSWPTSQGLLRGALARPLSCGNRRHAQRDLHFWRRPVPFLLMVRGGPVALLVVMEGDDCSTLLCWCGDFHRQGRPPPHRDRCGWPGRHGDRLGRAGQGDPRGSPTRRGVGSYMPGATATLVSRTRGEEPRYTEAG